MYICNKAICAVLALPVMLFSLSADAWQQRRAKDTQMVAVQRFADSTCQAFADLGKSPGLCIAIVKDGKVYMQGYGVANKRTGTPVTPNTLFEIGSITKVFTSCMTQLLADEGVLNWNDDIRTYLPKEVQLPTDERITLRRLATHTSGFPRLPDSWLVKLVTGDQCDPYARFGLQDIYTYLNKCQDKKPAADSNYAYSNFGAGLLGHILEWKTGKPYEDLQQQLICRPLGMAHTSVYVQDTTIFATGYDGNGKPTCHWHFPVLTGAGAIRSSVNDLLPFLQANMEASGSIGRSMVKTHEQQVPMRMGGVAYGWHVDTLNAPRCHAKQIIWHNGGTGGFRSYMGFVPGKNTDIIVLANQSSDGVDKMAINLLVEVVNSVSK